MAQQDPPVPIVIPSIDPQNCDCFGSTPQTFHPPFSKLSDIDLDICEIIALSLLGGAGSLDYNVIKNAFTVTACFRCMTPRQRREYEIWWVLYLVGPPPNYTPCASSDTIMSLINTIKAKQTPDAIAAALTGLRAYVWDYADCLDI